MEMRGVNPEDAGTGHGPAHPGADFERSDKLTVLADPYVEPPDREDVPIEFKLLLLPALVMLGKFIVPIVRRWIAALAFPYQMDGEEGFVTLQALTMYLGDSIYTPITSEPYLVGNYPPLVAWILSLLVRPSSFGLELGRLFVMECAVLSVLFIALTVGLRTRRALCTALAAVVFIASYEFHLWSAFCRVDFPALALTLGGLCLFLNSKSRPAMAVSALVFIAAGYARQTALLAPLACMMGLAIHDRRRLVWFAVPYLGCGLIIFAWLNVVTEGEFFRHTVAYNRNVMDWHAWRAVMVNEIGYFYLRWIVALVVGAALCAIARIERDAPQESGARRFVELPHTRGVVGIYALLATFSLTSFAKAGSAPNYALEPLAAWAVFGAETLARLFDMGGGGLCSQRRWARAGAVLMTAMVVFHGMWLGAGELLRGHDVGRDLTSARSPNETDRQVGLAVLAAAQSASGPVLSELPIFTLLAGKDVLFQPFIMSQLAREGIWDESLFAEMLDRHNFDLIITTQDLRLADVVPIARFTPGMVAEILRRYELGATLGAGKEGSLGQNYFLWRRVHDSPPPGVEKEALRKISSRNQALISSIR